MVRYGLVMMIMFFISTAEGTKKATGALQYLLNQYKEDMIHDYVRGYKKRNNIFYFNRTDAGSTRFTRDLVDALMHDLSSQSKEDWVNNNVDFWLIAGVTHNHAILKLAAKNNVNPDVSRKMIVDYNEKRKEQARKQINHCRDDEDIKERSKQELERIKRFEDEYQKAIEEWNKNHE